MVDPWVIANAHMAEWVAKEMRDLRPGGCIRVNSPSDVQWLQRSKPIADCEGCGAPLRAYIHHCEYCRRES